MEISGNISNSSHNASSEEDQINQLVWSTINFEGMAQISTPSELFPGFANNPNFELLSATVKWIYNITLSQKLNRNEKIQLMYINWRELFVLTAAQYNKYFKAEDYLPSDVTSKQLYTKQEFKNFIIFLKKTSNCKIDRLEFDYLKSIMLFRTDTLGTPIANHIEHLQGERLNMLQTYCSKKDSNRLGKLMVFLPNVCCIANQNLLEQMLFPNLTTQAIHHNLMHAFFTIKS